MTRQTYGKTWWGAQWLNALAHIDYDNRLPRGRRYANKGAVKELAIQECSIQAKVKGSRARSYQVTIKAPALPRKQVTKLLDRIAAEPALIARMLNRELDPALLGLADRLGIPIFPSRWKDLAMYCSCPDWAVPCKHLAAVIYLLSREIDGNPFLVFSLRGVDLAQALKSHDILIEREADAALPKVADLLRDAAAISPGVEPTDLNRLDLSAIPALLDPLLHILPERPAFFAGGDLRAIYKRLITRAAKRARLALDADPAAAGESARGRFRAADRPRIELDDAYVARLFGLSEIKEWPALATALDALEPARLPDVQPELAALYHVRLMALHLLAAGAVTPQIFSLGERQAGLRWLPATFDGRVRERMQRLAAGLPAGMVGYRKGRRAVGLSAETQASALCSLFLDHLIRQWSEAGKEKPPGDKTLALFFTSGRVRYDGPGEGSVAAGVQAWLARFHLAHREHAPVLCLDEARGGDFSLALAVENSAARTAPVPLSSVLGDKDWAKVRFGVLQAVSLLAEFFPPP